MTRQGLWLSRDGKYYELWSERPRYYNNVFQDNGSLIGMLRHKHIEDIFIKLDGTEMEVGTCIRVNLVEDDLFKGE